MSESKSKTVDLYRLLELSPLESDSGNIQAALKKVLKVAKGSQDEQVAKRAARLFELGKHHLLNSTHKEAYDTRWKSEYGGKAPERQTPVLAARVGDEETTSPGVEEYKDWDWSELNAILPAGDFAAEFDLAAYLEHAATLPPQDLQDDYDKLQSLLGGAPAQTAQPIPPSPQRVVANEAKPTTATSASQATLAGPISAGLVEQPTSVPIQGQPVASHPATSNLTPVAAIGSAPTAKPAGTNPNSAIFNASPKPSSLARKLRKKRDRSLLLASGGLLASVAAILGLIFVIVNSNKQDTKIADKNTQPNNPASMNQARPREAETPQKPKGSGLQIPGLENPSLGVNGGEAVEPNVADSEPNRNVTTAAMQPNATANTVANEPPNAVGNKMNQETKPVPPSQPKPEPQLSDADKTLWKEKMASVSQKIGLHQYSAAETELLEVRTLAKTAEQRVQLGRLERARKLAEECQQALVQAIQSLGGAETIQVGSRPISFIEGDAERLVIKLSGRNTTFKLTELPVGIFEGVVALKLDVANETDLARRAAFVLFHPKNNDLSLKKARERMKMAEDVGSVPRGMSEIFDEDYQL